MTLCISIARPRTWPLREGGLARLAYYVFCRDPRELRQQIAPVGRDFKKRGDSVVIQNNDPDGLLHPFANDAWMTAANNSGGLEMTLQRLRKDEHSKVRCGPSRRAAACGRKKPADGISDQKWRWTHSEGEAASGWLP